MNATPTVSYFHKLYLSTSEARSLEEIIILIRTRRWIHEITAYRQILVSGEKEEARALKGKLPGFTPSGVFKGGHKASQLETYSKVVGLDFDHVADLPALVALFRQQVFTLALFVSPGGEGLKVFVAVDTGREEHATAFAAVAAWYEQLAHVFCDRACKDISRCCYVSDDPDAWYNSEAEVFSPASVPPVQVFIHDWLRAHPPVEGSRNQTVYRLGCEANRMGFGRDETASFCLPLLHVADFTDEEILQALSSAYQGNKDEHAARPNGRRTQKDKKDTVTISGEELRERTPFLPSDITSGLPPLLGKALRFYTDPRERDMAFLAACTVLSACLPRVWGIYNRKRVYPHLFTVEVAPAGNGKSCINDMRRLADRYASLIEIETKRKEDDYHQALEEWELKKTVAHQKKQAVRVTDAPVKASTCYFFIPTQITKAKLLVHLAENGEIGGLMADSEIDTLISSGRQDYGQFDDLLRKAFHHEPVASSRKTDNEMIRIERPRLAVLLAGTPGQFSRLVPDAENGLASRLLLYTCRSEAVWQDVSSAGEAGQFEKYLDTLSEQVMEVALLLRKRRLQVRLTTGQWRELNDHFSTLLRETDLFGSESFLGAVKRHGLMAYRLCMIFTALEAASLDYGVDELFCSDLHFHAALSVIDVCLAHSRLLMTQLSASADIPELTCPDYFRSIFDRLPEEFTLAELYELGEAVHISDRTIRRHLSRLEPLHITRLSPGLYRKNTPPAA
ncbi:DUF3987 domain-containing protein [Parabacteroides sp.]|uniref:DUF3987 domain-containing protein n=1 Tax=Parabacteroides sp. TaxID=1869337 RepID=UPI003080EB02